MCYVMSSYPDEPVEQIERRLAGFYQIKTKQKSVIKYELHYTAALHRI